MAKANRAVLFLIYFVPILGWLAGLLFLRRQVVYLYHACQALAVNLAVGVIPLLWLLGGWVLAWVPLAGPVIAMAGFGLVIAGGLMVLFAWVMGLANGLRLQVEAVPFFGNWGDRIFYLLVETGYMGARIEEITSQEASGT